MRPLSSNKLFWPITNRPTQLFYHLRHAVLRVVRFSYHKHFQGFRLLSIKLDIYRVKDYVKYKWEPCKQQKCVYEWFRVLNVTISFTFSAKCLHRMCMKGMCCKIGAKSSDILYNSLVLFRDDGKHTCSWWRCVAHCLVLCPSSFPGFEIPIVDKTIHGGRNSISIGYGSQ